MKRIFYMAALAGFIILNLSGCISLNASENHSDELSNPIGQFSAASTTEPQTSQDTEPPQSTEPPQNNLVSYWDEYAKSYGGSKAFYSSLPMDVDLLPLYIAGMQHTDPYVRWACAYKAFDYNWDERKSDIIIALQPLLTDEVQQVRDAANFSTEVLTESFSGPEFIPSPNGKDIAYNPFLNTRFNDGKVWVYFGESRQLSMVLQLLSVGGDSGVAGYIQWSPDGSKLAVGDGGRLWSNTVILDLDTMTTNKQDLFSYLSENSEKFGYKIGDYQRPDPAARFLEWSPDSKKVLLSYYFAEDPEKWQSGYAIYNCETDKYERIMPNKASADEYPELEKPDGFQW
jgi:hypothetical protein